MNNFIRYQVGRFTAHIFVGVIFVGIFIFAIGLPIINLLEEQQTLTFDFLKEKTTSLILISVIFVSFSWIVIHYKYFYVPTRVLERTLMELAKKASNKIIIQAPGAKSVSANDPNLIPVPTFQDRIMANMYWISSLIIGAVYIGIEMYLLDRTIEAIQTSNTDGLVCSLFFFAAVPVFLILGLPIALGKVRAKNKALFLPLIVIVPMFGIIPLAEKIAEYESGENLKWFVIVGPPGMIFFWLAMAFLGLKKRRLFYTIFTFSCVFFFLPFVFLGLSQSSFFDDFRQGFFVVFACLIG